MFVKGNKSSGFGDLGAVDREPTAQELQKMIDIGEIIEKIANGTINATYEQRAVAQKIVNAMKEV